MIVFFPAGGDRTSTLCLGERLLPPLKKNYFFMFDNQRGFRPCAAVQFSRVDDHRFLLSLSFRVYLKLKVAILIYFFPLTGAGGYS